MKENLMKAITEELEFNTEIGEYYVNSSSIDYNRMILTIIDKDNEFDVTSVDCKLNKIINKDNFELQVVYRKSVWHKSFNSLGDLVDNIESAVSFLKDCAISVIKKLD